MEQSFDVLIIGAGASCLMAANEMATAGIKTGVLEARDRIGGRIHTVHDKNFELPVELGAEFIHGNLELTLDLLKKAGIQSYEVSGDFWQNEGGKLSVQTDLIEDFSDLEKKFRQVEKDIPVAGFLNQYLQGDKYEELRFSLSNYVEGYYAADTAKASTFALRDELSGSDEEQYRIEGGYTGLVDYLYRECLNKGVQFFLSQPVTQINWKPLNVEVSSETGKKYTSAKLIVTVPIGVLQKETLQFTPAIKDKTEAARNLGFGPVIKTMLQFLEPFWKQKEKTQGKDLSKLSFVFSEQDIPTWWSYHPKEVAMLTGWSGGPNANLLKGLTNEEILEKAMVSLSGIFSLDLNYLKKNLRGWMISNWLTDPWCLGGYSYDVVKGSEAKQVLKTPVGNTLYFSGEGLMDGPEIGTVNGALTIGRDTAHEVIASFKK